MQMRPGIGAERSYRKVSRVPLTMASTSKRQAVNMAVEAAS
jgi:hypothetical protein